MQRSGVQFFDTFSEVVDYKKKTLLYSEEQIKKVLDETAALKTRSLALNWKIKDTGVGMKQEQIDALWENEPVNYSKQRIGRYAIKNIRERLQLKYHEQYILKIESTVGEGTTVILEIPFEEGD